MPDDRTGAGTEATEFDPSKENEGGLATEPSLHENYQEKKKKASAKKPASSSDKK